MFQRFERWVDPFPAATATATATAFPRSPLRFLWTCVDGARSSLLALAACTAGLGLLEASLYRLLAHLVDDLSASGSSTRQGLSVLALLIAVLITSVGIAALQIGIKYQVVTSNLVARVRWRLHGSLLQKPLAFFTGDVAGRLATTVMQSSIAVRVAWIVLADIMVFVGIYCAALFTLATALSPPMLLPFLAWVLLYAGMLRHFVPRIGAASRAQAAARAQVSGHIADTYAHASTLNIFSTAADELTHVRPSMQTLLRQSRGQLRLVSGFEICNHLLSVLLIGSTAGLSVWLWTMGEVGLGAVAATTAMSIRLQGIAQFVMTQLTLLFDNLGIIEDACAVLGETSERPASASAPAIRVNRGEIHFEDVHFSYATGHCVLHGLNLRVSAGEHLGIAGASGAGKTSLVQLLLGLYQPTCGRITVDGQDIRAVCGQSLRSQIALVSQDTSLLNRSVADNIRLGRPEATLADIQAAAVSAGADPFIRALRDLRGNCGYHALVGDRGTMLSGGQRQRIAIARALLRQCPIVLLDEPTSSLDAMTESAVLQALSAHMAGRTVITISHRTAGLQLMDRIVLLAQGKVSDTPPLGSHERTLRTPRCASHKAG